MRASRLLTIMMLLQARGRMTAEALAEACEVSVRTIYRDIDDLSAAEVPVYADRGPNGGFALLDGYRTRLTGLSPDEAATLHFAGLPGAAAELGIADAMATAQLKLTAALPEGARASAARVSARFHLDPAGWFAVAEDARLLPAIADAVWHEKAIAIRYRRSSGTVSRVLHPLGLVLKGGVWYVVARGAEQVRTYRVSGIVELTATETHFERPQDFDLARFWSTASRTFETSLFRGTATLRVSPRGMRRLGLLGPVAGRAGAESAGAPDADGWTVVEIPTETVEQAAADIVRLGREAEVVKPAELRRHMAELARALCGLYAGELGPGGAG
jgi:predicted DNA-binding transcriptional regulator YafY